MNPNLEAFVLPLAVLIAFGVHWLTLVQVPTAAERLERSRGAYLGLSAVLSFAAWLQVLRQPSTALVLLALGMTASSVGDLCNLQFPGLSRRLREPLAWGIGAFMVAQVLYLCAFVSLLPLAVVVAKGAFVPILAALVVLPALLFRLRVYSPERPRSVMLLAFFYGFLLGTMAAYAVSAALAQGGAWLAVGAGALAFLASDAVMGQTTIKGVHPRTEFQVPWGTYLLAQGLIVAGFGRLAAA